MIQTQALVSATNIGVFGYGSLVNLASLAATIGRQPDVTYYVSLEGWARDWTVRCTNNSPRGQFRTADGMIPEHVLALNVCRQPAAAATNGILFAVSEADIAALDVRESHYDRVDVTNEIVGDHPFDIVYTYTGKPEALVLETDNAIIPASYLATVESGFLAFGNEAHDAYRTSTLPSQFEVVTTVYVAR